MALATTIYYNVQWTDEFYVGFNTEDIFHSPAGDRTVTYMNASCHLDNYYWGTDFSAIRLGLQDGSHMWLILPDEGKTVSDVLASGNAMGMIQGDTDCYSEKYMQVRLSLPKFDIISDTDLIPGLQALGITDVFDREKADFSSLVEETDDIYVNQAQHAVRVAIDEKGLLAAAYTVLGVAGSPASPGKEIDFVLDRPFLFLVESSDGLPLFTGVVNQP
jgi:serine protease inhibitor